MSEERLAAIAAETGVTADISDEAGVPIARVTVSGATTVGEIAAQGEAFGMPEGENYSLYRVSTQEDGTDKVQRLAPDTRLGDVNLGNEEVLSLRFAASLRGA